MHAPPASTNVVLRMAASGRTCRSDQRTPHHLDSLRRLRASLLIPVSPTLGTGVRIDVTENQRLGRGAEIPQVLRDGAGRGKRSLHSHLDEADPRRFGACFAGDSIHLKAQEVVQIDGEVSRSAGGNPSADRCSIRATQRSRAFGLGNSGGTDDHRFVVYEVSPAAHDSQRHRGEHALVRTLCE
jgi:hypothetical protein